MAANISRMELNIPAIRPQVTNTDRIANAERQIARIDREINAREKTVSLYQEKKDILEQLIASNEYGMKLQQESKQLLKESKELDQKMIANNNKMIESLEQTNAKLEDILARRRARSESPTLETMSKDAVKVSSNIQEASAKVTEAKEVAKSSGKELARSERIAVASNALEQVAKNKQKQDASIQTTITYSSLAPKVRTDKVEGLNIKPYSANSTEDAHAESVIEFV